ncbi:MAG: hypothetical protein HY962_15805 [Ignavibacteriae bacterium]|nr:hypothetical protein [Ignavibacteriota bacterium]
MRATAVLLLLTVVVLLGCGGDDPVAPREPVVYACGPAGLIAVVENSDGERGSALELAFEMRRPQVLQVLGGILGVDTAAMRGMLLNDILEAYGEPWMIGELEKVAEGRYTSFCALTDGSARSSILLDSIRAMSSRGLAVDLIFDLHSDGPTLLFSDGRAAVADLAAVISRERLGVRALYQTCCHAATAIATWETAGLAAVSGAPGVNNITLYSPIAFLRTWTGGARFSDAVDRAFNIELDTLRHYSTIMPELLWLMSDENLASSRQRCGGLKPELLWVEKLGTGS